MSGPCPVAPAGPICTTGAAGAYDTTHDLVHSRYAGNYLYDQAWVDATSPLTVDDVRFSSDDVPGDWATLDDLLYVYSYGNSAGGDVGAAFLHSYNYVNTNYNTYHYDNKVAADLKVAVDLKQEFEVCGLTLAQGVGTAASASADKRSCVGRIFLCCEIECTSRTLLHTWNVDNSAWDLDYGTLELPLDLRGVGQYFQADFDETCVREDVYAVGNERSYEHSALRLSFYPCSTPTVLDGRRLSEAADCSPPPAAPPALVQYDITGSGGVYYVDGAADPVALPPGDTIGMTIDSGHPLRLDVNPNGGCTETVTWTSDGGSLVSTDFHTGAWRVALPSEAACFPLSMVCSIHGSMQGTDRFVAALPPPPAAPPSQPPASPPPPAGARYECAFLRDDEAVTTADAGEVLEVRLQTTDTTLSLQQREIRNFQIDGGDLVLAGCTLVPGTVRNADGGNQTDTGTGTFLQAFENTNVGRVSLTRSVHFDVAMDEGASECVVTVRGSRVYWSGGDGDVTNTERSFAVAVAPAPAEGLSIGVILAIIVAGLLLLGTCIFLLVYFLCLARRDRECKEYDDEDERRQCEEGDARDRREQSRRQRERAALVSSTADWHVTLQHL